jgi:2-polyprenyl-3-methyl-5-hydroxy-6-metoxy-1,4-benzoquinol methylase
VTNTHINYDISLLRRDRYQRTHITKILEELKKKYNISNCSVLELGCGLGQNLEVFLNDNEVVGIEGLLDVVNEARVNGLNIVHQDLEAERIHLPDSSQDFILCLDVLEHLVAPQSLLFEIKRLLSPSGIAVLNVPNHFDLRGRIKILLGSGIDVHNFFPDCPDWNNPHIRFFTYKSFTDMVTTASFDIIDDFSCRISTIPFSGKVSNTFISNVFKVITIANPALFSGGFFLAIKPQKIKKI